MDLFLSAYFWKSPKLLHVSLECSFLLLSSSPLNGCTTVYIHSAVKGLLGCFQFLAIMNKASINIHVQVSVFCKFPFVWNRRKQTMPHGPHFSVFIWPYELRVAFTFVNVCKNQQQKKNMQQRHMWPAKLKVFTGWPFTENVCWSLL